MKTVQGKKFFPVLKCSENSIHVFISTRNDSSFKLGAFYFGELTIKKGLCVPGNAAPLPSLSIDRGKIAVNLTWTIAKGSLFMLIQFLAILLRQGWYSVPIEMVVWTWTLSHYKLDHIHWLISCTEQLLQEKKNPDPSQCPRGKGSCKKKWHSDVMFIKLCFNLNGHLGIEKYKDSF